MSRSRAVSDTLGFVLVFSLMLSSVVLVGTLGFSQLRDIQEDEQLRSAERAFEVIDDRYAAATSGRSPVSSSSLDLRRGTLSVKTESSVTVTVDEDGGSTWSETIPTNALVYEAGDTSFVYDSGSTFRVGDANTIVVSEPSLRCSDGTAIVTLVTLQPDGQTIQRGGTVEVVSRQNRTALRYPTTRPAPTTTEVTLDVDSPYAAGWERTLDTADGWSDPEGDGTYSCAANRVLVRQTVFRVRFVS